jgi:deoxycytidylate deaminase
MCAKAIINSGIDEVIYNEEYRDTSGLEILSNGGVSVFKNIR